MANFDDNYDQLGRLLGQDVLFFFTNLGVPKIRKGNRCAEGSREFHARVGRLSPTRGWGAKVGVRARRQ